MKRRASHATRNPLGIGMRRRRPTPGTPPLSERMLGSLRLGSRSALTLGLAAIMLLFIGLLGANFVGQVMQSAALEARRAELESAVAAMEGANQQLAAAVDFTESDVYVERVAREQLGYARDGDTVILPRFLPPPAPAMSSSPAELASPAPPATPNWRLWWDALFPPQV